MALPLGNSIPNTPPFIVYIPLPFSPASLADSAVVIIYVLLSVDQSVGACFFHTRQLTHTHTHTLARLTYFTIEWISRASCFQLPPPPYHPLRWCVVSATVFCSKLVAVCECVGLLFPLVFHRFPPLSSASTVPGSMYFRFVVKRALRVAASPAPSLSLYFCACVCLLLRELMVKGCVWFCYFRSVLACVCVCRPQISAEWSGICWRGLKPSARRKLLTSGMLKSDRTSSKDFPVVRS